MRSTIFCYPYFPRYWLTAREMLGIMIAWLKASLTSYLFYLTAPILFHSSVNGYIMSSYFLLAEIADTYGLFIVAFVIIGALILYRNKLFSAFRNALNTVSSVSTYDKVRNLSTVTSTLKGVAKLTNATLRKFINYFLK